jgi:hypothetical protein
MAINQLKYTKEEFAQKGNEIYETQVRPKVEEGNRGKIVAIDIEIGAFELAKDAMTASRLLLEKQPNAQIWRVRIGHKGVHRLNNHFKAIARTNLLLGGVPVGRGGSAP